MTPVDVLLVLAALWCAVRARRTRRLRAVLEETARECGYTGIVAERRGIRALLGEVPVECLLALDTTRLRARLPRINERVRIEHAWGDQGKRLLPSSAEADRRSLSMTTDLHLGNLHIQGKESFVRAMLDEPTRAIVSRLFGRTRLATGLLVLRGGDLELRAPGIATGLDLRDSLGDFRAMVETVGALDAQGIPEALARIAGADPLPGARTGALHALAESHPYEDATARALAAGLGDPVPGVRLVAARATGATSAQRVLRELALDTALPNGTRLEAVSAVCAAAASVAASVAAGSAAAAWDARAHETMLASLLHDPRREKWFRGEVLSIVARGRDPRDAGVVGFLLGSGVSSLRKDAMRALRAMGKGTLHRAVLACLRRPDDMTEGTLAEAIRLFDADADPDASPASAREVEALLVAVLARDGDARAQISAAELLGRIGTVAALGPLEECLARPVADPALRDDRAATIESALGRIRSRVRGTQAGAVSVAVGDEGDGSLSVALEPGSLSPEDGTDPRG